MEKNDIKITSDVLSDDDDGPYLAFFDGCRKRNNKPLLVWNIMGFDECNRNI